MHNFVLMLAIIVLPGSTKCSNRQYIIIGGKKTTIGEHPYQVSVQKSLNGSNATHTCGGTLIKLDVVLTAAHCMRRYSFEVYVYTVKAGSTYRSHGGEDISVLYYVSHPKYHTNITHDYDVSILKLKKKFSNNPVIATISLAPKDMTISDGTMATTTGWGRVFQLGVRTESLRKMTVIKYNHNYCKLLYSALHRTITNRMTCYGGNGNRNAKVLCQGDSGGPLVVEKYLVGIVSWGRSCTSQNRPGVYTNLKNSEIQKFIYSNLS